MTIPSRPKVQHQGPTGSCVISGKDMSWLNCTPESGAMGLDKATLGRERVSGCTVRKWTDDTTGGTTLAQVCNAIERVKGIEITVRVGSNIIAPSTLAGQLRAGRGFIGQGNTGALIGTTWRSTGKGVNHAVWFNEGRGWKQNDKGVWLPADVLAFDPAADGRNAAWGKADVSPSWWSWSRALRFFAELRPWGDSDSRTLGPGKVYAGLFPDTEPHVHLRFTGSRKTTPFPEPRKTFATAPRRVNIRSGPSRDYDVVATVASGTKWTAYQENTQGESVFGSRLWFGNHDGDRWIHSSGLREIA